MIKNCGWCHGKGKRHFIKRMSFGPEPEIDAQWIKCEQCNGEGKIYVCPVSKAPVQGEAVAFPHSAESAETILDPVRDIPSYAVIIRCIHCRGEQQAEALAELDRRGLWLSTEQKIQAGLIDTHD